MHIYIFNIHTYAFNACAHTVTHIDLKSYMWCTYNLSVPCCVSTMSLSIFPKHWLAWSHEDQSPTYQTSRSVTKEYNFDWNKNARMMETLMKQLSSAGSFKVHHLMIWFFGYQLLIAGSHTILVIVSQTKNKLKKHKQQKVSFNNQKTTTKRKKTSPLFQPFMGVSPIFP